MVATIILICLIVIGLGIAMAKHGDLQPMLSDFFNAEYEWGKSDALKCVGWSEEDEHRVKDTIYFLETAKNHYASTVELDACIDWLKSLRPQPKSAWSKEDDDMLDDAIGAVGAADYYTYDDKQEIEKWLKSLKHKIGV